MRSSIRMMLAMAGVMLATNDPFTQQSRTRVAEKRKEITDYDISKALRNDHRQLKEFSIKGRKVMAYSRKDAITRLKHMKKI